jgi:hypothetical protein
LGLLTGLASGTSGQDDRGVDLLVRLLIETRGVQIAGAVTTTSALRGVCLDDGRCRREFLDFDRNSARFRCTLGSN